MKDSVIVKKIHDLQRRVTLWNLVQAFGVLALPAGMIGGFMFIGAGRNFLPALFLSIAGVLGIFWGAKAHKKAEQELKNFVGEHVIKAILSEKIDVTEYKPAEFMNEKSLRASGILPGYDRISGSDYIRGTYKGQELVYCDIELEQKHEHRDSDGHNHTEWITVFKGPFVRMPLGKEMKGYVKIKERKNKRKAKGFLADLFDTAADALGIKGDERTIDLESEAFNNQFEVKTTDEELAFYILTPQFMENIIEADQYADGYTNLSFKDGIAYIAINNGRDSFEVTKTMYSVKRLEESRNNMKKDLNRILLILDEILKKEKLFSLGKDV